MGRLVALVFALLMASTGSASGINACDKPPKYVDGLITVHRDTTSQEKGVVTYRVDFEPTAEGHSLSEAELIVGDRSKSWVKTPLHPESSDIRGTYGKWISWVIATDDGAPIHVTATYGGLFECYVKSEISIRE